MEEVRALIVHRSPQCLSWHSRLAPVEAARGPSPGPASGAVPRYDRKRGPGREVPRHEPGASDSCPPLRYLEDALVNLPMPRLAWGDELKGSQTASQSPRPSCVISVRDQWATETRPSCLRRHCSDSICLAELTLAVFLCKLSHK
jgi:hypothetical protein